MPINTQSNMRWTVLHYKPIFRIEDMGAATVRDHLAMLVALPRNASLYLQSLVL